MNHVALAVVRRGGLRFVPEPLDHFSICAARRPSTPPSRPGSLSACIAAIPGALRRFPAAAVLDRGGRDRKPWRKRTQTPTEGQSRLAWQAAAPRPDTPLPSGTRLVLSVKSPRRAVRAPFPSGPE